MPALPPDSGHWITRLALRRSAERKIGLRCSAIERLTAMGQLLVTLIVPPIVGLLTYIIIRRMWERDENAPSEAGRPRDPNIQSK